eukprot:tig00000430_g651.t1
MTASTRRPSARKPSRTYIRIRAPRVWREIGQGTELDVRLLVSLGLELVNGSRPWPWPWPVPPSIAKY